MKSTNISKEGVLPGLNPTIKNEYVLKVSSPSLGMPVAVMAYE